MTDGNGKLIGLELRVLVRREGDWFHAQMPPGTRLPSCQGQGPTPGVALYELAKDLDAQIVLCGWERIEHPSSAPFVPASRSNAPVPQTPPWPPPNVTPPLSRPSSIPTHDGLPIAFPTVPSLSTDARCRSCGKAIAWRKTVNDKNMPLDLDPTERGEIEIRNSIAHVVKGGPSRPRYITHWATCSNRDQHRRA